MIAKFKKGATISSTYKLHRSSDFSKTTERVVKKNKEKKRVSKKSLQSSTVSIHSNFSYMKKYKQNFELNLCNSCFKMQSMNLILNQKFIFN